MIHILLVSPDNMSLSGMLDVFDQNNATVTRAETGSSALSMVADNTYDLVVTDENVGDMTGFELAEKMIAMNPMINCAAVSSLSPKDFHEESEGLGLLMQLPVRPDHADAGNLLDHLGKIINLTGKKT